LKTNITLIGFMGTGKTAVGRSLASLLKKDFVDTDAEIEKVVGLKVEEIFFRYGEVRFRSEESLIIKKVAARQNCVISTGGGAVLNKANWEALRASSYIVCLVASPAVIQSRVARRVRPLLRKDRSLDRIQELLKEREPFYQGADLYIDTSEVSHQEVAQQIYDWWNKQEKMQESSVETSSKNIDDKIDMDNYYEKGTKRTLEDCSKDGI